MLLARHMCAFRGMPATREGALRLPVTRHAFAAVIRFSAGTAPPAFSHRQTDTQNIYKTKDEVICQSIRTSIEFDKNNYP
jgi:hypothetical protein